MVYDLASHASFNALPTFLNDARALASPNLAILLAGNKLDISSDSPVDGSIVDWRFESFEASRKNTISESSPPKTSSGSMHSSIGYNLGSQLAATHAPDGREVNSEEASRWASASSIPVSIEVSAYNGEGVDEMFAKLARTILTKIELGEIDPDDPQSGIQYGDSAAWGEADGGSIKSSVVAEDGGLARRRRKSGRRSGMGGWTGMQEWEAVFRLDGVGRRRRGGCC